MPYGPTGAGAKPAAKAALPTAKNAMGPRTGPSPGGPPRWKVMVWTVSFASVACMGAYYGAGLKIKQEYKAEMQKAKEESGFDEKRALLELRRTALLRQKTEIDGKLADLRGRMQATADGKEYISSRNGGRER